MIKLKKHSDTLVYAVLLATGLCANNAFATSGVASSINQTCQAAGNPMTVSTNSCTACHNDGSGGNGAGKTAARGNNATIISFFCPNVSPPEPIPAPTPTPQTCTDADGDGFNTEGGNCGQMDCNDNNPAIYPGATERCTDGVDNNCNSLTDAADPNAAGCPVVNMTDADKDGYTVEGGRNRAADCDDGNPDVNPGVIEICNDGVDNNCDGSIDAVDATCQVIEQSNDPVLEKEHRKAQRRAKRKAERQHRKEGRHDRQHKKDGHDDDHDD